MFEGSPTQVPTVGKWPSYCTTVKDQAGDPPIELHVPFMMLGLCLQITHLS